jgi:hypothetical protein
MRGSNEHLMFDGNDSVKISTHAHLAAQHNIINILVFSKTFASCYFCCVRRETNEIAYSLVKFSSSPHVQFFVVIPYPFPA